MANAQVKVQLIPHARVHYLAVAGYRYMVQTRNQGRNVEHILNTGNVQRETVEAPKTPETI